ncbi:16S rRNA (cytosine(1402)-N(4))-methyltransferase [Candidatus Saccharibacteria bacterium]|nr:MAG: 16S rRNA (cytosine(1402)-N(4))-methyltransferase [Candidatus Saccharibacteria bacterium]
MSINEHPPHLHVPVLLNACLDVLQPKAGESYLDLTAGFGGHARAFLDRTANYQDACCVDRDEMALRSLLDLSERGVRCILSDFVSASQQLASEGRRFDIILADLGVSSPQLDRRARGFSFTSDGPLDMRMDSRQELTAAQYLNTVSEAELADVIQRYGEEPKQVARRYARAIIAARPLATTGQLAHIILDAHVGRWRNIHPATRTFQAIRIRVNDELGQLERLLPYLSQLLAPGGRVGIISFHSLEDRIVKRFFAEQAASGYEAELRLLTKKPRYGTEDVHNPRARSAKLRAAVKT